MLFYKGRPPCHWHEPHEIMRHPLALLAHELHDYHEFYEWLSSQGIPFSSWIRQKSISNFRQSTTKNHIRLDVMLFEAKGVLKRRHWRTHFHTGAVLADGIIGDWCYKALQQVLVSDTILEAFVPLTELP